MMRKSQIEAAAYKAMQDAQAAGKSESEIIRAGQFEFWQKPRANKSLHSYYVLAKSLYDKHFTVKNAI